MQPMPGTAEEMGKRKTVMRSLMDAQRIETEEDHAGWCTLCGGLHDDRHCVQDVVEGVNRPAVISSPRYPAKLIPPGVSGGDLAQKRRIVERVGGPIRVGARFQSAVSSFVFVVTNVNHGNVTVRRGGHRVLTSLTMLANPRKWRRVG